MSLLSGHNRSAESPMAYTPNPDSLLTVLVVDEDEPSPIANATALILDGRVGRLLRAGAGDEAIALHGEHRPDMIVVHWRPSLVDAGVTIRQDMGEAADRSIVAIVDDHDWLAMAEARMCCADRAFWRSDMSYGLWMAAAEARRREPMTSD